MAPGVLVHDGMGSLAHDLRPILERILAISNRHAQTYGEPADPLDWLGENPFRPHIERRWDTRRLARRTQAAQVDTRARRL